jgi:hypothetical protein
VITTTAAPCTSPRRSRRSVASIWGNTIPEFGMYPYIPRHPERAYSAEVQGLDCRPCSKIGFDQLPQGTFHCMEMQDLVADRTRRVEA